MKLTKGFRDAILVVSCVVVPFFPLVAEIVPPRQLLFGLEINWYQNWQIAIWTMAITALPVLISGVALLYLPLKKITLFTLFLIIAFYTAGWQFWTAILPIKAFNSVGIAQFLALSTLIVGAILFFKLRKSRSEREKKEDLLRVVDQMTKEDLPQLFLEFANIGYYVDSIGEPSFVQSWRNALKNQVSLGNEVVTATILKLEETKNQNL